MERIYEYDFFQAQSPDDLCRLVTGAIQANPDCQPYGPLVVLPDGSYLQPVVYTRFDAERPR